MKLSTIEVFKHLRSRDAIELTDAQLHELQKTLNGMLFDIVDVCERYGIRYNLGGGTALGAVRHGGFIPWDDDVDLNMPRRDHDRFVEIFEKECGDRYWVHTPRTTKNYGLLLSRVLLKGTSVKTREDFWNSECGCFVDIFPIENTYNNAVRRKIHGLGCMALGFAQSCRKFYRDREPLMNLIENGENGEENEEIRKVFRTKIRIGRCLSFWSLDHWTRVCDSWYRRCRDEDSTYVSVPSGKKHFFGELCLRDGFVDTKPVLYEGRPLQVAANADRYLTRLYGNWKKIPKQREWEKHVYFAPFYLSEEEREAAQSKGEGGEV